MTKLWVRTTVALTVSVAVGMAPFLGTIGVPFFSPLLSLLPLQIRGEAITLGSALMGLIAVGLQWHSGKAVKAARLQSWFKRAVVSTIVTFVTLLLVFNFLVVRVQYLGGEKTTSFIKGFTRPVPDICAGLSDESCIKERLSFDPAEIDGYWGSQQVSVSRLLFLVCYLALLSHFAVLVGLLVLKKSLNRSRPLVSGRSF
jgi:hypothetical protein